MKPTTPIFSLSGVPITDISPRDMQWLEWIEEHGASDDSIHRFLEKYPPPSASETEAFADRFPFAPIRKQKDGDFKSPLLGS